MRKEAGKQDKFSHHDKVNLVYANNDPRKNNAYLKPNKKFMK